MTTYNCINYKFEFFVANSPDIPPKFFFNQVPSATSYSCC